MSTPATPEALDDLHIPVFKFPWTGNCSPSAVNIEHQTIAWLRKHELTADEHGAAKVARARFGWLAARCYPHAEPTLLQTIADFLAWFFLFDDLVDRVSPYSPTTITHLTALIDVLDLDQPSPAPTAQEVAWRDICQRLKQRLSGEQFQRFAQCMRMWTSTCGLLLLNQIHRQPVDTHQHEILRRHTSGVDICMVLADIASHCPLSPEEYYRADLQQLRLHANNIASWSNDIHSLVRELHEPGPHGNLVTSHAALGHTLQISVDFVAQRVRDEISLFSRQSRSVSRHAAPGICHAITAMQDWLCGYQDWIENDTQRYA
ncbi:terpene synthase family protein [Pseudomonas sp.]|uniref:terpene synthase family protein n=1 Tax=Pseudomonas sp. TaxID=306 RepID=UPI003F40B97A